MLMQDWANVDVAAQESLYQAARTKLAPYVNRTRFLRMTGKEALGHVADGALDFIFIDARHDYCATKQDMIGVEIVFMV